MPNQRLPPSSAMLLSIFLGSLFPAALRAEAPATQRWAQAWGVSQHTLVGDNIAGAASRTIAQRARISMGGNAIRIKLSNELGKNPLNIGAASVAPISSPSCKNCSTPIKLSFGGAPSITIPAGALAFSDEVELNLPALSELEIKLFIPTPTAIETGHHINTAATAISMPGDYTARKDMPIANRLDGHTILSGIDIRTNRKAQVVVAFGDSLTRGITNQNWPDRLAERFARSNLQMGIVNSAIGGTMLMRGPFNGQARLDRDAFAVTGVTHVILLMGTNDIGSRSTVFPAPVRSTVAITADEMISAYKQLIRRAHARGIKIIGATLPPFSGAEQTYPGYYSEEGEKTRQAVNSWIRNNGEFDGVIDFDKILQDPNNTRALLPAYDSGDHLHISDAGYKAMAEAIDLSLFR